MKHITSDLTVGFYSFQELPVSDQSLLTQAAAVRHNAQAPYSNFLVGVAMEFADEKISVGCNHEVCSYSQTSHAEQVALTSHIAQHGKSIITKVAIVAALREEIIDITSPANIEIELDIEAAGVPCGHCLQTLWENCNGNPDVPLLMYRPDINMISQVRIADALPFRFGPSDIGITV